MSRVFRALPVLLAALLAWPAGAAPPWHDDFIERYSATYRFRLGQPTAIRPAPDGDVVWFLRSGPRSFVRDLWELDAATGRERRLLSAEQLLGGGEERLSDAERARRERQRLVASGIASYEVSDDGRRLLVPLSDRLFVYERDDGTLRELPAEGGAPLDARFSPDGRQVACVREGELWVIDLALGEQRQLTRGAGGTVSHGLAEFVAQEEMGRQHGYWWSPDGTRIVYQQTDTAEVETLYIPDAAHPERAPRSAPYPRPGHANARVRLGIVGVTGGPTTWIEWDRERYEYLALVRWEAGAPLTVLLQNREQTEQALFAVDLEDGALRPLLEERDPAWVEIDETVPRWLADGTGFLWTTEREGALQLELRDREGALLRSLTPVAFGMQAFVAYLRDSGAAIVAAGSDPTETRLWRVPLDPAAGEPRCLDTSPGVHGAVYNRAGTLAVRWHEDAEGRTIWRTTGGAGSTSHRLRSVAEAPGFVPRLELTEVEAAGRRFHAAVIRPTALTPGRRYPVIVHVYGGPTSSMVRRQPSRYLVDQWIAEHGFIVVAVDGRGTPHRGRDWQRAVHEDLISAPLADQAAAVRALGRRHAELDLNRVGIYGWSFGGYFSALAVMREPDLFRAGVAGAPVTDWHDYDTHYTERYMGLPQSNPEGYRSTSALTWAEHLDRPLLVLHGTADDNVYFMHSLKLADALFRAGRPFEFLPLSGFTHMVPDAGVTRRLHERIVDFFERHLAEPGGGQPD